MTVTYLVGYRVGPNRATGYNVSTEDTRPLRLSRYVNPNQLVDTARLPSKPDLQLAVTHKQTVPKGTTINKPILQPAGGNSPQTRQ